MIYLKKGKPQAKSKMKWKVINLALWRGSGFAIEGGTYKEFEQLLKDWYRLHLDPLEASPAGCYVFDEANDVWFIWLRHGSNHGEVAHEASHATFKILNSKGLSHNDASEEAFTYTLTYILEQFYDKKGWLPITKFDPRALYK